MLFIEWWKAPASENLFEVNELTNPKHAGNLHVGAFMLILH